MPQRGQSGGLEKKRSILYEANSCVPGGSPCPPDRCALLALRSLEPRGPPFDQGTPAIIHDLRCGRTPPAQDPPAGYILFIAFVHTSCTRVGQHVDFDDRYASVNIDDAVATQIAFVSVTILVCAHLRSALDLGLCPSGLVARGNTALKLCLR